LGWSESWLWRRQESYLRDIDCRETIAELSAKRLEFDEDLKKRLRETVKLRTFFALKVGMTERIQGGLVRFATAIKQIGKGTGIRARRFRRDAREAMSDSYAAVPCWIMPTWRVSESRPAELGSFDLVIVDEASQSDIGALPALLRGKKLLIVGDDKQVSPTAAFVEERKILQLRHNFLGDQPFASMVLPGGSLYDLANAMFPGTRVMLQEHFRCVEPIIRFSMRFYTEPLIPLRVPKMSERLDPPLIDIYIPEGKKTKKKTNEEEAAVIVDEIERLTRDPSYANRTIGVVSLLGPQQAHRIQKLLLERIGEAAFVRHQIACGDSGTFQGKERSIMFVSLVASPPRPAAQTARAAQQRFNVALSRARDRMYLVRSVDSSRLNPKDLKSQIIAHFEDPMRGRDTDREELIALCQSGFERNVFTRLTKLGYRVTPQVSAGPYSIDLVVEGLNDRRLAIELDGDQYHPPEQWHDDLRRQRALERVGWTFWRCWGSSFLLDPDGCMEELLKVLEHLEIDRIGGADRSREYCEHRVVQGGEVHLVGAATKPEAEAPRELQLDESQPDTPLVAIGDRVRVEYSDEEPRRESFVEITNDTDDPDNGVISIRQPLAETLLGAGEEDEVEFEVGNRIRTVTVLGIEKGAILQQVSPEMVPEVSPEGSISADGVPRNRGAESTARDESAGSVTGPSDPPQEASLPDEISSELWRKLADWSAANGNFELGDRGLLFLIADGTYTASADLRQGRELMRQAVRLGFDPSNE
jgi:very-short-patch-repair endonuclease